MPGHTRFGAFVASAASMKVSRLVPAGQGAEQASLTFRHHGRDQDFGTIYFSSSGYYTVAWPGAVDITAQSQCTDFLAGFQSHEGKPVEALTPQDSQASDFELSVSERFELGDGQRLARITLKSTSGLTQDQITPFEGCDFKTLQSPSVQFLRLDFELLNSTCVSLIITRGSNSSVAVQVAADMASLGADERARLLGFPPMRWAMRHHFSKPIRGMANAVDVDDCASRLRNLASDFFGRCEKPIHSNATA